MARRTFSRAVRVRPLWHGKARGARDLVRTIPFRGVVRFLLRAATAYRPNTFIHRERRNFIEVKSYDEATIHPSEEDFIVGNKERTDYGSRRRVQQRAEGVGAFAAYRAQVPRASARRRHALHHAAVQLVRELHDELAARVLSLCERSGGRPGPLADRCRSADLAVLGDLHPGRPRRFLCCRPHSRSPSRPALRALLHGRGLRRARNPRHGHRGLRRQPGDAGLLDHAGRPLA